MVNKGHMTPTAAEEELKGTVAADKNEILFSRFGINYNNEPDMFRKGSVVFREYALVAPPSSHIGRQGIDSTEDHVGHVTTQGKAEGQGKEEGEGAHTAVSKTQAEKMKKLRRKAKVVVRHVDIIKEDFWLQRPWLRTGKPGQLVVEDQGLSS